MPWIDLVSRSDWCSIWYISNGKMGTTASFDATKPAVLLMHPIFLDSSWLRAQLDDARLSEGYNLVAMDTRCHGRTKSTPTGWHDIWVEVADVGFFCHRLRLPPMHIFAAEAISTYRALRFAALFPEMVLSLTLCQVPPPPEKNIWNRNMHAEIVEKWCAALSLDTIEDLCCQFVDVFVGDDADLDLKDEINCFYQRHWPPTARTRIQETVNLVYRRTMIEKFVFDAVVQPTLIIQGEWTQVNSLEAAESLVHDLVNVEGGARLYTVVDGKGYINVVPSSATVVNQTFAKFLSSLPHHCSHPLDYQPLEERMATALAELAKMTGNPEIATRDPHCPLSFSLLSSAHTEENISAIYQRAPGQANAFSSLGPNDWPVRAYSERVSGQWAQTQLAKGSTPQPQPSALGVIPIGPTPGRLSRRTSDQDLAGKLVRLRRHGSVDAKGQQRQSAGSRPTSADATAKPGHTQHGTAVPDPATRVEKPAKGAVKKFGASARSQG